MKSKQFLALVGASVLFLGVFAPIVHSPLIGSQNYFQNGRGDGVIIMTFAILAAVGGIWRRYSLLWVAGVGSLGMLTFTFVAFQLQFSEVKGKFQGTIFQGFADWAVSLVQLQWGLALLFIGSVILISAAIVRDSAVATRLSPTPRVFPPLLSR